MGLINGKIFCSLLIIVVIFGCANRETKDDLYTLTKVTNDYKNGKDYKLETFNNRWISIDDLVSNVGKMTFFNAQGEFKNGSADFTFESEEGEDGWEGREFIVKLYLKNGKVHGRMFIFGEIHTSLENNNYYSVKLAYQNYELLHCYHYVNGILDGQIKGYKNGLLKSVSNYRNNIKHGKSFVYQSNGRISSITEYAYGDEFKSVTFFQNGQIKTVTLTSGNLITQQLNDLSGKIIEKSKTITGLGNKEIEYWNENKRKFVRYSVNDKVYMGSDIIIFNQNGFKKYELSLPAHRNDLVHFKVYKYGGFFTCLIKADLKDYPCEEISKEENDHRYVLDYKHNEYRQYAGNRLEGKCNLQNKIIDGEVDLNELELLLAIYVSPSTSDRITMDELNHGSNKFQLSKYWIDNVLIELGGLQ